MDAVRGQRVAPERRLLNHRDSQPGAPEQRGIPVHNDPGSESVQFSPTKELRETQTVIRANLEAVQTG